MHNVSSIKSSAQLHFLFPEGWQGSYKNSQHEAGIFISTKGTTTFCDDESTVTVLAVIVTWQQADQFAWALTAELWNFKLKKNKCWNSENMLIIIITA